MLKLKKLMSTKDRKNKKKIKNKNKITQHYILKRPLRLDMVKRMYRHNENDECSIFYYSEIHHLCFSHLLVF